MIPVNETTIRAAIGVGSAAAGALGGWLVSRRKKKAAKLPEGLKTDETKIASDKE